MGFRMRKSINLGGGVRLNLSKSGVGMSLGVKGLRAGIGPRGTRFTASIPSTGLSYQKQGSGTLRKRASKHYVQEAAPEVRERSVEDVLSNIVTVLKTMIILLIVGWLGWQGIQYILALGSR